ncbi:MAG: acylphosphatase [Desulfurivibrionaceae bacterium]|nr:acylphosphatase [Desulfurivibrionaceae bacterium]
MEKCVRAVVSGQVQGVFFRAFTQEEAERLQVSGWVRNRPGGEVEALICGPAPRVDEMVEWLGTGSPQSRVDKVAVAEISRPDQPLAGFTIRS